MTYLFHLIRQNTKVYTILKVRVIKDDISKDAYFNSEAYLILNDYDKNNFVRKSRVFILNRISEWISYGSDWTIEEVLEHKVV